MAKFRCEHCNQKIAAPDAYVGKRVKCPRCKQPARVPQPSAPPAEVARSFSSEASEFDPLVAGSAASTTPPALDLVPPSIESVIAPPVAQDPVDIFSEWLSGPAVREPLAEQQVEPAPVASQHIAQVEPAEEQQPQFVDGHPGPFEVQTPDENFSEPPAEIFVPPSQVIDKPVGRRTQASSADEVADLLRTLREREHVAAQRLTAASSGGSDVTWDDESDPAAERVIGWAALGIGVVAVAMACIPATSPYAVPVGSAGLLLALTGVVLATGRGMRRLRLLVGGATVSAMGVTLAVLVAFGIIPPGTHQPIPRAGTTPPVDVNVSATDPGPETMASPASDVYIPATSAAILNHVEIRVASAQVLQPAIYTGDYVSLHTMGERRVQITLELKDLGTDAVTYEPWRKGDAGGADAKLTDADGNALMLNVFPNKPGLPATLPVGSLTGPTNLTPGGRVAADVLLFEPPGNPHEDLNLDLPGANLGVPNAIMHIRIPAAMVQAD